MTFLTQAEKEQHIQFRLIHVLSNRDLVRKLLTMEIEVTISEMLVTCHTHITISDYMSLMGLATTTVNAVQKVQKKSQCGNCTKPPQSRQTTLPSAELYMWLLPQDWVLDSQMQEGLEVQSSLPGKLTLHITPKIDKGGKKTNEVGVSEEDSHCDEVTIHT